MVLNLSATTAAFRAAGGCTDATDNNANDFTTTPFTALVRLPACALRSPTLSINDVAVRPGNAGTTAFAFVVFQRRPVRVVSRSILPLPTAPLRSASDYAAQSLTAPDDRGWQHQLHLYRAGQWRHHA